jgi:hypothetical protein
MPWQVLALFASAHMVNQDAAPVRSSCDSEAQVIGQASKGDPAQILFAISGDIGTCYKVALTSGGKALQGHLPAKSLSGIESFEQGRRSAGRIEVPAEVRREIVQRSATGDEGARIQRLMSSDQNEQALELLQGLMKRGHRDANTLAAAGLAAFQSDQPKVALEYFDSHWRSSLTPPWKICASGRYGKSARTEAPRSLSASNSISDMTIRP